MGFVSNLRCVDICMTRLGLSVYLRTAFPRSGVSLIMYEKYKSASSVGF